MPFKDPEVKREYNRTRYLENREAILARVKAYTEANPEKAAERGRLWVENNRERSRAIKRRYELRQPKSAAAERQRQRRAAWRARTPPWFGELDALVVREAADLVARRQKITGGSWHVDHILPLQGARVSGLHVWQNLQVVPAAYNFAKAATFDGKAATFWPVADPTPTPQGA
jgi:hypothetical protein